jgi:hypothetical protein
LPSVLGTSEPKINAADLKTRGWEETDASLRNMVAAALQVREQHQ